MNQWCVFPVSSISGRGHMAPWGPDTLEEGHIVKKVRRFWKIFVHFVSLFGKVPWNLRRASKRAVVKKKVENGCPIYKKEAACYHDHKKIREIKRERKR